MACWGGQGRVQVVDVADWIEDESFATYPEGARSKRAYFPSAEAPAFIRRDRRHLLKRSDKRYPAQFWGEVVASYLGDMLAVPVPPDIPQWTASAALAAH